MTDLTKTMWQRYEAYRTQSRNAGDQYLGYSDWVASHERRKVVTQ